MRFLVFLFLSGCSLMVAGQRKYHCEYKDTVSFIMSDSALRSFREKMEEQGLSGQMLKQVLEQLSSQDISFGYQREVDARSDSTFILVTRKDKDEGNMKMNMPDKKLLFRKGELHEFDSLSGSFFAKGRPDPKRTFKPDGNTKIIMNHSCSGYTSTDSSCRIWVAADLPSYINPGVIAEDIKGAILAFELKQKGYIVKSEMDKME